MQSYRMTGLQETKKSWIKKTLEEANKLIFVKCYQQANSLLNKILSDAEGDADLLVHLRAIELAGKLGNLEEMRANYQERIRKDSSDLSAQICLGFVEQHIEEVSDDESVEYFEILLEENGPHAAVYFGLAFSQECVGNFDRAIFSYNESLKLDPTWFPSYFGLSQIYYQTNDGVRGDQFFYQFEQSAPYNLYGNFETHKNLSTEFLEREMFQEAETAIQTLPDWWIENRNTCPAEIRIYENFSKSRIARLSGDLPRSDDLRSRGSLIATQLLQDSAAKEDVLYFTAKVMEEFGENVIAVDFYKKILRSAQDDPDLIQKIGSQFLSQGEFELAKDLFRDAYYNNPNSTEIKFCLLVAELKLSNVAVEEYLHGRERLRKLIDMDGDKVEILSLLHSLLARFDADPTVHGHLGNLYQGLGNTEKARKHFERMYELDHLSTNSILWYTNFAIQHGDAEAALEILSGLEKADGIDAEKEKEINWLKAEHYLKKGGYHESLEYVKRASVSEPWTVSYLIHEAHCLIKIADLDISDSAFDELVENHDALIDWASFNKSTLEFKNMHRFEIVYVREKLNFLYNDADPRAFTSLIESAKDFNAQVGIKDLVKILNTNYDSPIVQFGIGLLFKDIWQLESSVFWFEQIIDTPDVPEELVQKAYVELADSYIWQNTNLGRAIQYAKMGQTASGGYNKKALVVLAHGYLKSGDIKKAKQYLEQDGEELTVEGRYLLGLFHYRNGAEHEAKQIWKPLITVPTTDSKVYHLKRQLMSYYFEQEEYLKVN